MTLPAWAIARPENRVGKIFSDSPKSASADLDQTLEPRRESRCYVYDFASGMRIYLYCQNDPVNNADPSGNDIVSMLTVMNISASLFAQISPIQVQLPGGKVSFEEGEKILIERYNKAKSHYESRNVKHHGKKDASCWGVNFPLGQFMGPPPESWILKLEHRSHWYGFPMSTLVDHWAVVARTKSIQPNFKELLFDYWGDRPAGENPNTWFRQHYEGMFRDSFDYSFSPTAKPENYAHLDTIPAGAD